MPFAVVEKEYYKENSRKPDQCGQLLESIQQGAFRSPVQTYSQEIARCEY
ncbi:hypothetical protein IMSAGC016_00602 [Muribaculaceae bacterium]|nr:hypothetical protein IMSAGC016_00602 [Muribaculaceae bacterium]